jgi:hypothetical protein
VIGLTSDDPRVDVRIALRSAITALPVVAADRVMAVAVLTCQQVLAELDGRPEGWLDEQSQQALARAPYAADWARRYTRGSKISVRTFRRHAAPSTVRDAVVGIARASVADPDRLLYDLLAGAIEDCRVFAPARPGGGAGARADRPDRLPDRSS